MKILRNFTFCFLISTFCSAQEWTTMMQEPGRNFYEIQAAFNEYWKDKNTKEKGQGYKQFKRWENFVGPRVYPTGDLSLISTTWQNFEAFEKTERKQFKMLASTTWTAMGPFGAMSGVASNGFPRKAGRDNFITFHPTNSNIYWTGAPAGGLWKTTTNGTTWTTNTDNLTVIGCSDLSIDPSNPNIMYLATGDGDSGDTYSIGVLKSIDGGLTWNPTGLVFPVNLQRLIRRMIINPVNPQVLLVATNVGIYRTANGGTTWTQINSTDSYDVEFKPNNPNIVYFGGGAFYRSVNGGSTFSIVNTGISTTGINRMNIAVTPADTNYVYVLASSSANNGLQGVYRSLNSGATFSLMANSPNILANQCSSPSTGGQGWYDLALAASPLNKNEIVVGGINVWRSTNGGTSYSNIGCWIGTGTPPYVHADQHELEYTSTGILYSCNDGGIFRFTGSLWTDLSNPKNIAQIYKIGLSALSPALWITGHQDNGSNIFNNGTYQASMAGDGMDCFIDRTNNNNMFASYYNGSFQRSTNGGTSWTGATTGMSGGGAWVSPWKQDPTVASRLYAGLSTLYVSNNLGINWTALTSPGGSGDIVEFAIAPSNNQVIYIIRGTSIRKSINGGSTWTNVTGSIPVSSADPTFITIDPNDANTAWVTLSGYAAGSKVFQTTNGGTSWTNISSNLPNLPANCSVYQPGTADMIYVGMDVGVYYKDNTSTTWTLYNNGLPNVPISDLEISPAASTKLRAATYGRGVYEVDVIAPSNNPVSNFTYAQLICQNSPHIFTDNSTNSPTSWSWSVSPSTAQLSSSTAQNPVITFPATGNYTVSMMATNSFGQGSLETKVVNISAAPQLTVSALSRYVCVNEDVQLNVTGAQSYTWQPGGQTGALLSFTAAFVPHTTYTITGKGANGCTNSDTLGVFVSECTGIMPAISGSDKLDVFPNPATNKITIRSHFTNAMTGTIIITDVSGKIVNEQTVSLKKGGNEINVDIQKLPNGIYLLKLIPGEGAVQTVKLVKEF